MDYRPFKDTGELNYWFIKHYCKGAKMPKMAKPLIWLKDKDNGDKYLIIGFSGIKDSVCIASNWVKVEKLFDDFTFCDDKPCGMPIKLPTSTEAPKKPFDGRKKRLFVVKHKPF